MQIFDALFAPLARLLVAQGVPFPDLVERMKLHYVQAALAGDRTTDSRISVMTGLQRRDVVRLRDQDVKDRRPNPLARLVALWQTGADWSRDGKALPLPRSGPHPSFESLTQSLRRDVHPRTLLDTLLAVGTVALSADGHMVRLVQTSYQPLAGSEDQLAYLARNLGDHTRAATENVQGAQPAHFERAVHYSGLTKAQISALSEHFSVAEMKLFQTLSQTAALMQAENPEPGPFRFRAGGYFYQTKEAD